jgi:hypothetical protein
VNGDARDVEIDVFGVPGAVEEESEIAPSFDGETILVGSGAEQPHEVKVEEFHGLAVGQHWNLHHAHMNHMSILRIVNLSDTTNSWTRSNLRPRA